MQATPAEAVYTNPVTPFDFPDPFVLKYNGEYYAYGTSHMDEKQAGRPVGNRLFTVLRSRDLVHWQVVDNVLERPKWGVKDFWNGEVYYKDGTFYMYYSAEYPGRRQYHIAVATAAHPAGPFRHQGLLVDYSSCIDAHVFRDIDGQRYLYYSQEEPRAVKVYRLNDDMVSFDGGPVECLVPTHRWEMNVVEGVFVVRHRGRYVMFYSGGCFWGDHLGPCDVPYAINYATAPHPLGPWTKNEAGPVFVTRRGHVVGPGCPTLIEPPDGTARWLVYHGWDAESKIGRQMRLDPIDWSQPIPCLGQPSTEPRPCPRLPRIHDFFDAPAGDAGEGWGSTRWGVSQEGTWLARDGGMQVEASAATSRIFVQTQETPARFVEVNACLERTASGAATYGFYPFFRSENTHLAVTLCPAARRMDCTLTLEGSPAVVRSAALPTGFDATAFHRLAAYVERGLVRVYLDDLEVARIAIPNDLLREPATAGLCAQQAAVRFAGVSVDW